MFLQGRGAAAVALNSASRTPSLPGGRAHAPAPPVPCAEGLASASLRAFHWLKGFAHFFFPPPFSQKIPKLIFSKFLDVKVFHLKTEDLA